MFLIWTIVIVVYFGHRILKMSRMLGNVVEGSNEYRVSFTSQAVCELGKDPPNFSPLLNLMRDEVREAGGGETVAGKEFLAESLVRSDQGADAASFRHFYASYRDALSQAQRK